MKFNRNENEITYEVDGERLAYLKFVNIDNVYSLNSTFVDPSLRGQGIAAKLMDEMIAVLQENNATCIPVCSYTLSWFEKHPEYRRFVK